MVADLPVYFVLTNPLKKTAQDVLVGGNRKAWGVPYE